jgi:hypothetical protein
VLLLLLLSQAAFAQAPTATFTGDRKEMRLSESLRATLTIQGEAPLRVELPKPLLDPIIDRDWKIQPLGSPDVTQLPDGRERWTQTYRLDPYVPGKGMPVIFAAVKVNGREVLPGGFEVTVITTITEAKAEAAKPVTGIEELPPPPSDNAVSLSPWWGIAVVAMAGAGVLFVRLRRKVPPVPPHEWALGMLDHLEQSEAAETEQVALLASIVREFIERRFGIAATKLTTQELLATTTAWPAEHGESLQQILDVCDRAKFAGDVPDAAVCRELLTQCRQWVRDISVTSSSSSAGEPPRP